jgi:glycerophosphoryl diester phosphodiesterase
MAAPRWLTARPIAHRGLHEADAGVIENTASAFAAAIAGGYGIECDLQVSADGEAMVHHDDALGRLTEGSGALAALSAAALRQVKFRHSAERMLTLGELCDLVAGRVPLFLELKSRFDGDSRLAARTASVLSQYKGPAAAMSFDPGVVSALRALAPTLPRGIVAQRRYRDWPGLTGRQRLQMTHMMHLPQTRPHFVAYAIRDLPALVPAFTRSALRLPLLAWTVRTDAERRRAANLADQIIFEGFRP